MQHDKLERFLGQASIPKLFEEERLSCEGRITIEECVKALDTFENGKTPGNDGIPAESYKTFWNSILDIIDYTESLKLPGILLFIDFEKAFDSIEWDFLYQSLEAFNFGPTLIRWIKTFYNNLSSCVLNNGLFSKPFKEV